MKYAIRVEETKGKTYIVEADNLDDAINKIGSSVIDLEDEISYQEIFVSPFANKDGTATKEQLEDCEIFEE